MEARDTFPSRNSRVSRTSVLRQNRREIHTSGRSLSASLRLPAASNYSRAAVESATIISFKFRFAEDASRRLAASNEDSVMDSRLYFRAESRPCTPGILRNTRFSRKDTVYPATVAFIGRERTWLRISRRLEGNGFVLESRATPEIVDARVRPSERKHRDAGN